MNYSLPSSQLKTVSQEPQDDGDDVHGAHRTAKNPEWESKMALCSIFEIFITKDVCFSDNSQGASFASFLEFDRRVIVEQEPNEVFEMI